MFWLDSDAKSGDGKMGTGTFEKWNHGPPAPAPLRRRCQIANFISLSILGVSHCFLTSDYEGLIGYTRSPAAVAEIANRTALGISGDSVLRPSWSVYEVESKRRVPRRTVRPTIRLFRHFCYIGCIV